MLTVAQFAVCGGFRHALLFVEINPPPFVSNEPPLLLNADNVHAVVVNKDKVNTVIIIVLHDPASLLLTNIRVH